MDGGDVMDATGGRVGLAEGFKVGGLKKADGSAEGITVDRTDGAREVCEIGTADGRGVGKLFGEVAPGTLVGAADGAALNA